MIENFIDRNKDGNGDGGYPGILSLIDAIETENYRDAEILQGAPYKISRRASREQVYIVREFVWLQMLNRGMKTWGIAVSDAHTVHGNGVVVGVPMFVAPPMIRQRWIGGKLAEEQKADK